jgi:hypothetical protein
LIRGGGLQCFAQHVRPEIVKQNPGLGVTDVAKIIGAKWKDLDDAGESLPWVVPLSRSQPKMLNRGQTHTHTFALVRSAAKAPFIQQAARDKARFRHEMDSYVPNPEYDGGRKR